MDHGNFAWASERVARKTRVIDVVYNASNNELVRTKTLVKNCIVLIDAAPFRLWYESNYALPLVKKKTAKAMVRIFFNCLVDLITNFMMSNLFTIFRPKFCVEVLTC